MGLEEPAAGPRLDLSPQGVIVPATAFYVTHPQVQIDPAVPVPLWGLSAIGRARALAAAQQGWTCGTTRIVSSAETKAIETAEIFAARLGLTPEIRERMHENDRCATGFLPPAEFEIVADAFFAHPDESVRGWEVASSAQARIVSEVETVLAAHGGRGDILFVGHGAVGTLLMTHLLGVPISRTLDQPGGGGNVFAFECLTRAIIHRWQRFEEMR